MKRIGVTKGAATALGAAAYTWIDLGIVGGDSVLFPWPCYLDRIEIQHTAINPGGNPTVSVLLAYDAAHTKIASILSAVAVVNDPGDNTAGSSIHNVVGYFPVTDHSVPGHLYVGIRLSAGTSSATPRAIWARETD